MQYDLKLYSYTRRLRNLVVLTLSIQTDSRKLNSNKITKGYTESADDRIFTNKIIEENLLLFGNPKNIDTLVKVRQLTKV